MNKELHPELKETLDYTQRLVDKFTEVLDKEFNGMIGPAQARTHKGTPYVTVCIGGMKKEGEPSRFHAFRVSDAVSMWLGSVLELSDKNKQLVWRVKPEVTTPDYYGSQPSGYGMIQIRSRLAFE